MLVQHCFFPFSFFKVIARMQILDFGPHCPVLVKELDSTKVKPLHGGSVGVPTLEFDPLFFSLSLSLTFERHMHGTCKILVCICVFSCFRKVLRSSWKFHILCN